MANAYVIPTRTINFKVYSGEGGNEVMVGLATVDLPEITFLTETIKGAGIAGEIDQAILGHLGSMSVTLNFNAFSEGYASLLTPGSKRLKLRASVQTQNTRTMAVEPVSYSISMLCSSKAMSLGSFEVGAAQNSSITLEVEEIAIRWNDVERLLIEKFNMVFRVDGVDYLQAVRRQISN